MADYNVTCSSVIANVSGPTKTLTELQSIVDNLNASRPQNLVSRLVYSSGLGSVAATPPLLTTTGSNLATTSFNSGDVVNVYLTSADLINNTGPNAIAELARKYPGTKFNAVVLTQ